MNDKETLIRLMDIMCNRIAEYQFDLTEGKGFHSNSTYENMQGRLDAENELLDWIYKHWDNILEIKP